MQSENGPHLSDVDKIIASAMDKYWQAKGEGSDWHFCHKTEDVRTRIPLDDLNW